MGDIGFDVETRAGLRDVVCHNEVEVFDVTFLGGVLDQIRRFRRETDDNSCAQTIRPR